MLMEMEMKIRKKRNKINEGRNINPDEDMR